MLKRWIGRVAPAMAVALLAFVLLGVAPRAQAQQWGYGPGWRGNYPAYYGNNWLDRDHNRWRDNRPYGARHDDDWYRDRRDRDWRRDRWEREHWRDRDHDHWRDRDHDRH